MNSKLYLNSKRLQDLEFHSTKDALSSLRNFLETESPLKASWLER